MVRGSCISTLLVVLAVASESRDVEACSSVYHVQQTIPTSGEHPANAAVIVTGVLGFETVTATIDGLPVTVVLDESLSVPLSNTSWTHLGLRFEPPPLVGQSVVVNGRACEEIEPESCEHYEIAYVATEADSEIAPDQVSLSFDLMRRNQLYGNSCGDEGSVVFIHLDVDPDAFAAEPYVSLDVRVVHEASGIEGTTRRHTGSLPDTARIWVPPIGLDFAFDGWCVEVTSRDAAGNVGETTVDCEACMFSDNPPSFARAEFSPIPGGPCDDGSTTSTSGGTDGYGTGESSGGALGSTTGDAPPNDPPSDPPSGSSGSIGDESSGGVPIDGGTVDRGCGCGSGNPTMTFVWALLVYGLGAGRRRARANNTKSASDHVVLG